MMASMKTASDKLSADREPVTRHYLAWCMLSMVLALACTGCRGKAKVTEQINPAGVYTLMNVDGKDVPCTVSHQGHSLNIKSGVFTINSDGTCTSRVVVTSPRGDENSREVKATYTLSGSTLTMKWQRAGVTTGRVKGESFTMNNEGMVFAYRR